MTRLMPIRPSIRFGDLNITASEPKELGSVLISLDSKDTFEDKDHKGGTVWLNKTPIGFSQKVSNLTQQFMQGQTPTEQELRDTIKSLVNDPEELDTSPEKFKLQHLLKFELIDGKKPAEAWKAIKPLVQQAAEQHSFKPVVDGLLTRAFGNKAFLVPKDTEKADEIFLTMIEWGCVQRKPTP